MAGLHKSEFENPVIRWVDSRLPIFTQAPISPHFYDFPYARSTLAIRTVYSEYQPALPPS